MIRQRITEAFIIAAIVVATNCRNAENVNVATEPPITSTDSTPESSTTQTIPDATMERGQIPARYQWSLSTLFSDDAEFDRAMVEVERRRGELRSCRGELSDAARLETCMDLYFSTRLLTNRLTLYSQLRQDTDGESSEIEARVDRSQRAMNELMGIASLFRGEILSIDDTTMERTIERRSGLAAYRPYIEQLRRRRNHVLGEEAERVLTLAGDNLWAEIDLNELPSDHERAFGALISEIPLPEIADESGQTVQLTFSNYGRYRASEDRRVRRDTVEGLFASLRRFDQSFAALLGGQARFTVFLAQSRGYEAALDAYLGMDDVDPAIYRGLVSNVEANLEPLQRYMRLRRRLMDVEEMHIYDLYTPLVPASDRQFPFEQAREIVAEALTPLGEDYLTVLRRGLDPANGWIDVYPHDGKRSGAFSASVYGEHPFVFMNYFNQLRDVLTLAHEYGHALHFHYAMTNQPYVTADYVPLIAETASTFNEVLVIRHLIEQADNDDERLSLLNQLVEMIRGTIYRQALFASFELALHTAVEEETPITAQFLDESYRALLRRYYGEALTIGDNDGMEWAYVPHFYYKYYLYAYTGGLCSGIALGERVLAGGEAERDAYLNMLGSGSSRPPLELLRGAGVDPSTPEVVEAAARLMNDSLDQMESIIARRGSGSGR